MTIKSSAAKKIASKRASKSKSITTHASGQIARNGDSGRSLSQDARRAEKDKTSASDLTLRAWEKTYANRSSRKAS
jgi:hypothetical protein